MATTPIPQPIAWFELRAGVMVNCAPEVRQKQGKGKEGRVRKVAKIDPLVARMSWSFYEET